MKKYKVLNKILKLHEAPIDYYGAPERVNKQIEKQLATGDHPISNLPMYPDRQNNMSFEELITSERFRDVLKSLKRYTNYKGVIKSPHDLATILMDAYETALRIEISHKDDLVQLAIDLVRQEFNIPKGVVEFVADLKNHGEVDLTDIPDEEEVEEELEGYEHDIAKRKFLNSLIQGAAVKTTYAYHLVRDRLNAIDPDLINIYSILSAFSEYGYWVTPDKVATANKNAAAVGKSQVDLSGQVPKIKAQATTFPFLVHELSKGVMELLSSHSLPEDPKVRKYILSKSDFMNAENWNLRLGPGMWERFKEMVGVNNENDIISNLYAEISTMPNDKFNTFMKELMSKSERGKQMLKSLANEIRIDIKQNNLKNLGI